MAKTKYKFEIVKGEPVDPTDWQDWANKVVGAFHEGQHFRFQCDTDLPATQIANKVRTNLAPLISAFKISVSSTLDGWVTVSPRKAGDPEPAAEPKPE
jgi:hypothetical protein